MKSKDSNLNPNPTIILEVKNLSKTYRSQAGEVIALENVNITVKKSEFLAILGPSGSGKSTLLNMIGAFDKPTSGKVFIRGIDIFSSNEVQLARIRNRLIGFVFQSFNLINRTTVQKNVELPAIIAGMNKKLRSRRALELLKALGIRNKAGYTPPFLSGGQQQRVAIARALMNNPAIILADEPTGNLDSKTSGEVARLLSRLSKEFGTTILAVTHSPEMAKEADRIVSLHDGKIINSQ